MFVLLQARVHGQFAGHLAARDWRGGGQALAFDQQHEASIAAPPCHDLPHAGRLAGFVHLLGDAEVLQQAPVLDRDARGHFLDLLGGVSLADVLGGQRELVQRDGELLGVEHDLLGHVRSPMLAGKHLPGTKTY